MDQTFANWASKGLCIYGQLCGEKEMKSFEQLSIEFCLPNSHPFRYFQVRSFIFDLLERKSIEGINPLIKYMLKIYDRGLEKKVLTNVVKIFKFNNSQDQQICVKIKNKWENELSCTISPIDWGEMCKNIHYTTISMYWREYVWKVLMRYFKTPLIQSKYKDSIINLLERMWGDNC